MKKSLLFAALLAACATMEAQTVTLIPNPEFNDEWGGYENGGLMGLSISPNGKYVCGTTAAQAGFVYELGAEQPFFAEPLDDIGSEFRHVNNAGVAMGFNGPATTLNAATGQQTVVAANTADYETLGEDISADGEWMVGEIANHNMTVDNWQTKGVVWHNGEMTILPCPTNEEMGFNVDGGTKARFISADGTVIVGSAIDDFSTFPIIAWKRQADGSWQLIPISKGLFTSFAQDAKGPYFSLMPCGLSQNGKWVALNVTEYEGDEDWGGGAMYPVVSVSRTALYNMETGEISVFKLNVINSNEETGEESIGEGATMPTAVANDGTIVGYQSLGRGMNRAGVIRLAGSNEMVKLCDALPEVAESMKNFDDSGVNTPTGISEDGTRIAGFISGEYGYETYVVELPAKDTPEGIESTTSKATGAKQFFSLDGRHIAQPTHGLYIERDSQGKSKKVVK